MFDPGFPKAGFMEPTATVRSREIESCRSLDQHIETHQETEGIVSTLIVDQTLEDDVGSSLGQGLVRFADQHLLIFQRPVMQDMPHDDHFSLWKRLVEEISSLELEAVRQSMGRHILLKNGTNHGQIKISALQVGVSLCQGHRRTPLGTSDIHEGLVLLPGEFFRDGHSCTHAESCHRSHEQAQPIGIPVDTFKEAALTRLDFILG